MLRLGPISLLLLLASLLARGDDVALVGIGEEWRYTPGMIEPSNPPTLWREPDFDDGTWLVGGSGFGYTYWGENTALNDFSGLFTSAYFRKSFTITDAASIRTLILRLDWQGGFVAYLNGHELLRQNLTNNPAGYVPYNQLADPRSPGGAVDFDVSTGAPWLGNGTNVLAIQVHGAGDLGSRLVLVPELVANFNRGPMVQNVSADQAWVVWETPQSAPGVVEFGPSAALGRSLMAAGVATRQAVLLTNLMPGSRVYYRVTAGEGSNAVQSPTFSFRTLSTEGDASFVLWGDSGAGSGGQMAVARQMVAREPDFALHLGDVVYPQFSFPYTDTRFLSVYRYAMRSTPLFAAWGNHDLYAGSDPLIQALRQPTNSVSIADHQLDHTRPEFYFSFDQGDAHVAVVFAPFFSQYVLTTNSPQYAWLTNDLARSSKPWKFMAMHHPVASSGPHRFDDYNFNGQRDMNELAAVLYPVAARYGVQIIFAGHDHDYQRFHPVNGVHHVVSGGGGSILHRLAEWDANAAQFQSRYHLTSVEIRGDTLRLLAIGTQGEVFDALEFRHTPPDSDDPDGDGLGNDMERLLGTNPHDPDTDGDGLPDGWEFSHALDPRVGTGADGPAGDPDHDGVSNLAEFLAATHPRDPVSLRALRLDNGHLRLVWLGMPGQNAQLEEAVGPAGPFTPNADFGPPRPLTTGTQSLDLPANAEARFFRIRLLP
ncbi:MAG TPA: metallophosphoesterase [Candidatus Limnocylindria bacterium]|jgi:hypothetical protein|nr:metallophosphoesterase [Candidatus Limnocylindria bacterium]